MHLEHTKRTSIPILAFKASRRSSARGEIVGARHRGVAVQAHAARAGGEVARARARVEGAGAQGEPRVHRERGHRGAREAQHVGRSQAGGAPGGHVALRRHLASVSDRDFVALE